jgi:hypothetical protein
LGTGNIGGNPGDPKDDNVVTPTVAPTFAPTTPSPTIQPTTLEPTSEPTTFAPTVSASVIELLIVAPGLTDPDIIATKIY